jgi:hypothetical protein
MDDLDEIKEKVAAYKKRELGWFEFAPFIEKKRKEGIDSATFEKFGLPAKAYSFMTRAYRFLSVQRLLDREMKAGAETVSLLPVTYRRLKGTMSDKEFHQIILDVIDGKIGTKKLSMLGRGITIRKKVSFDQETLGKSFDLFYNVRDIANTKFGNAPTAKVMMSVYERLDTDRGLDPVESGFKNVLAVLEAVTQVAIEKFGRDALKAKFGPLCHALAIELECIADKDFHEAQNERGSFKV